MKSILRESTILACLALVGAGCGQAASFPLNTSQTPAAAPVAVQQPKPYVTKISAQEAQAIDGGKRIDVPEFGITYVIRKNPITNFTGTVIGNRIIFGNESEKDTYGFIEKIPRASGQSFQDAVQAFLDAHGFASDQQCVLDVPSQSYAPGGWTRPEEASVLQAKTTYVPTMKLIVSDMRSRWHDVGTDAELAKACDSPDLNACGESRDALKEEYSIAHCSSYSRSRGYFMTNGESPEAPVVYVSHGVDGMSAVDDLAFLFIK
jgi:hypothetical protein